MVPLSSIHSCSRSITGSSSARLRFGITGSSPCRPSRAAAHDAAIGQLAQRGLVGVHTVAPSSISPWFRSPGARSSGNVATSSAARVHAARVPAVDLMSTSIANTRATTRATLPSTIGVRSPNAIDAMAPAVYGPMPGIPRSCSAVGGNAPPHFATSSRAPFCRLRARE